jgi:cytochrome c-type biogenesis protein CcmE
MVIHYALRINLVGEGVQIRSNMDLFSTPSEATGAQEDDQTALEAG